MCFPPTRANILLSLHEQFNQYQIPFLALPFSANNLASSPSAALTTLLQNNADVIAVFTDTQPHPQPILPISHLTSQPYIHKHIPVFDVHQDYTIDAIGNVIVCDEGQCPGEVEEVLIQLSSYQVRVDVLE